MLRHGKSEKELHGGEPHTTFRGKESDMKLFWTLTGCLANTLELPLQDSDEAKKMLKTLSKRFFIRTDEEIEPLLATDGMPVRKGAMAASIAEGKHYVRPEGEAPIRYELCYTLAMPEGMKPFQTWNEVSQDDREITRVSERLLKWIFDIAERLVSGNRGTGLPEVLKHWLTINPRCKEVLSVSDAAMKACMLWAHPTSEDMKPDAPADAITSKIATWGDAPYANPSMEMVMHPGNAEGVDRSTKKFVLFFSSPAERAFVRETTLRLSEYDSPLANATSLREMRKEYACVWNAIVSVAKDLPLGKSRETAMVTHDDGAASAPRAITGNKRKARPRAAAEEDAPPASTEYASIVSMLETLQSTVAEFGTTLKVHVAKETKFRASMRKKMAKLCNDLTSLTAASLPDLVEPEAPSAESESDSEDEEA